MSSIDSLVWSAYLDEAGRDIDQVWYDVWCGAGEGVGVPADGPQRRLSDGLYCKRIDAVTCRGGLYSICEVKPWGNYAALGQVLMYADLFRRRYRECRPVEMAVVCALADPDCRAVLSERGIRLLEVGPKQTGLDGSRSSHWWW